MVQLKGFRVIEPEELIEEQPKEERDDTSVREQVSPDSNSNRSIVSGGNLTSESSLQPVNPTSISVPSEEDEATTLSSNQEYQMAKHELVEDEDSNEEEKLDVGRNDEGAHEQTSSARSPQPSHFQRTSETARNQLVDRRLLANSSPIPPSPLMLKRSLASGGRITPISAGGDSSSLRSLARQNLIATSTKHFEVRWHNINLYSRKSKLPRFVTDNPIYKLFKRTDGELEQVCYSPPIKNKFANQNIVKSESSGSIGSLKLTKDPIMVESASNDGSSNGSMATRQILRNVSGSVFSGQMTAILGPSGVGKTSLLNSLTGRNTLDGTGRVSLIGGASKRMAVVTVPQQDVLPGKLTTLEDLRFTSRLKNPGKGFNHARNINRIVQHLHMEKFLNTRIDKLSGGEARRLSIGRELLSSPDIMILDEPTSGLDANTCKKIIMALRDIVEHSDNILDKPMSVIVTIHQPQREVLNLFHRVYVMARGGRVIYEGPPCNLLPTLLDQSSLSQVCKMEQLNENPAIVALEAASNEYGAAIIDELAVYHERQTYEENLFADENTGSQSPYIAPRQIGSPRITAPMSISPQIDFLRRKRGNFSPTLTGRQTPNSLSKRPNNSFTNLGDHISTVTSVSYASTYDAYLPETTSKLKVDKRLRRSVVMKGDFLSHTLTLMQRCWLLTTRDMFLMAIRILGFVLVAGGMVQIFSGALNGEEHQCPTYESEIDDIMSFMQITRERLFNLGSRLKQSSSTHLFFFHLILCIVMVTSALAGLVFPLQMRMFVREYKNGWYSPASFITGLTLAELPVDIIGPLISLLITYPLCNQPVSDYYWREIGYAVVLILAAIICKSQAQMAGALLMDSVENSVFISCVLVTPPVLLSGIPLRVSQMPSTLQFLSYGSFLRYVFESLLVLRYGYNICPCDPDLVNGYPIRTSASAIPPQLDNLARGFLELNQNVTTTTEQPLTDNLASNVDLLPTLPEDNHNFFVQFLRLVTDSSNMFVPNIKDLGDCNRYRSLFLMDMEIEDKIIPKWLLILLLMFILSRFITYFVIKTVIKMRR